MKFLELLIHNNVKLCWRSHDFRDVYCVAITGSSCYEKDTGIVDKLDECLTILPQPGRLLKGFYFAADYNVSMTIFGINVRFVSNQFVCV